MGSFICFIRLQNICIIISDKFYKYLFTKNTNIGIINLVRCGYSSMAECELPKLNMRVRFPLSAFHEKLLYKVQ